MKKRVFITGISSLLMKKLCDRIDPTEYEIIGLTRNPSSVSQENSTLLEGDLHDISKFTSYIENCDILIHAAAETHAFNKKDYTKTNIEGTKRLIDIAKGGKSKRIIYISSNTANEYSGAYAKSKLEAENYIKANIVNWSIIRLSEVFGKGCVEGIEKLIQDAIHKAFILCPTGMPFKFSPIHIEDVSELMYQYIFSSFEVNSIKNINGNERYSFKEILHLVKKHKKLNIIYLNKKHIFIFLRIINLIPFYIGIIPDQIERLYGFKSYSETSEQLYSLKSYIEDTFINRKHRI